MADVELIREHLTWDTPRMSGRDRTALSKAEERAPDDVEVRVTRYWLPGYTGYALVAWLGARDWLMELWVHPGYRGEGRGTMLLSAVLADREGRELVLDEASLAVWYGRHGFRCDGDMPSDIYMVREADRA
jgi:GNAT superfamily N-acetyltransferase